jgi:hypothetical protein
MQQTNGMTSVINQEQSDLVTSATLAVAGSGGGVGQKESIKNGKSVIITNNSANINKNKITTILNHANNTKSNGNVNNNTNNNNNNNIATANKNSSNNSNNNNSNNNNNNSSSNANISSKNQVTNKASTNGEPNAASESSNGKAATNAELPDARQVLKEAVDAVVNSFTKHTQGYGRGEYFHPPFLLRFFSLFDNLASMTANLISYFFRADCTI